MPLVTRPLAPTTPAQPPPLTLGCPQRDAHSEKILAAHLRTFHHTHAGRADSAAGMPAGSPGSPGCGSARVRVRWSSPAQLTTPSVATRQACASSMKCTAE